jgi:hypothetical protein
MMMLLFAGFNRGRSLGAGAILASCRHDGQHDSSLGKARVPLASHRPTTESPRNRRQWMQYLHKAIVSRIESAIALLPLREVDIPLARMPALSFLICQSLGQPNEGDK